MQDKDSRRGWYQHGRLPHADYLNQTQAITIRQADSLPADIKISQDKVSQYRSKLLALLDNGYGSCVLTNTKVRKTIKESLKTEEGMLAFCIMPNHTHLMIRTHDKPLGELMRHLKGRTTRAINKTGNNGQFWAENTTIDIFATPTISWPASNTSLKTQ